MCNSFFANIDKIVDKVARKVKGLEFSTFLVGTKVSKKLLDNEEKLWEKVGIEYCEPIKAEINREVGKRLEKKLKKKAELKKPEISILIDLENNKIDARINSVLIFGYYSKLKRGMPQCRWGTPKKYKTSVEQIIAKPFMPMTRAKDHKFHGAGREDIDALCLGWRSFVLELVEPRKRKLDLKQAASMINKTKKVKVRGLKISSKDVIRKIKSARPDKTYRAVVKLKKKIPKNDMKKLRKLKGEIRQRTPERVLHRRAELQRKREVKSISWKQLGLKKLELKVKGTAGLYIKELVSGDKGRTSPSVAELLGTDAVCRQLDVVRIGRIKL